MTKEEIKGLKYYLVYGLLLTGFFIYSGFVGLKWFNSTETEHTQGEGHRHGYYRMRHK